MKATLFLILLLFVCSVSLLAQSNLKQVSDDEVGVEGIFLAKDDGQGKAGELSENFLTTDVPIYCIVQLDSMKAATVKMNLVAVNVKGVKPETKVITVSYTTNGKQSRVNFTGAPEGNWVAGSYRIDVFVDNKPAGKENFEVVDSSKNTQAKQIAEKPLTKSKFVKRFRKN